MKPQVWSVNLEQGDCWWYAHVAELPGCFTRGETRDTVLRDLSPAIAHHLAFLKRKGRPPILTTLEFRVVEELHGISELGEAGGVVALFTSDKITVDEEAFRFFLDLMQWNREELIALIDPLTEDTRNTRPLPTKWTINETLQHIANAEEWYISRLGPTTQETYESEVRRHQSQPQSPSVFNHLTHTRLAAVHGLRTAFLHGVQGTFSRAAYTQYPDEQWTFRKVIRRFIEHEREHIQTIAQLIKSLSKDLQDSPR